MRIAFLVGGFGSEPAGATTARLAFAASRRGHETFAIRADAFQADPGSGLRARARRIPVEATVRLADAWQQLSGVAEERVTVADLDALVIRLDPAAEAVARPWAMDAGLFFGELAQRHGVVVLNHPGALAIALHRHAIELLPEEIRPRTRITRDREEARAFARELGTAVIRPLRRHGGTGLFVVRPEDHANVPSIVDSVSRDGYVLVQEHVPEAESNALRLFLVDGEPLARNGRYAAFRRSRAVDGKRSEVRVDDAALHVAAALGPKFAADGVFFAAIDVAGGRLVGVDLVAPAGLGSAGGPDRIPFAEDVIDGIERKVAAARGR